MDDDELIAAVGRGDDIALRELFARHAPWLAARLRAALPAAEVEDVLQETFLAVWRGARGYRPGPGSGGGWIWGIARRQAALWLRRRGPAPLLLPAGLPGGGLSPQDPADAAQARADLAAAVSALGPEGSPDRETWRLMYAEDRPVAEVAELMGVPVGTVKSRAHRAPPAVAGGAAPSAGQGRRRPMTGSHDEARAQVPPDVDLDRVWAGLATQVWRRTPGRAERLAGRLLHSPGLARALLTTPSLLLGWVIATVVVLAAGAVATLASGTPWVALAAPALAAAGIAYAYGPGIDPAFELCCSMAVSDRMVLLTRALTIFALNALLGVAASAVSGAAAALTFGWLVPMTAMCGLALATATLTRSGNAGVAAGLGGWVIIVLAGKAADGQVLTAITDSALILPYLAVAACGTAIACYITRIPRGTA